MRNTAESTEAGSGKIIRDLSGDLFVDLLDDLFGDLIFAGKAGFPGLRRLNNNRQQTTTDNRQQQHRLALRMLPFKNLRTFRNFQQMHFLSVKSTNERFSIRNGEVQKFCARAGRELGYACSGPAGRAR